MIEKVNSHALQKRVELNALCAPILADHTIDSINEGDIFIDHDGQYTRIDKLELVDDGRVRVFYSVKEQDGWRSSSSNNLRNFLHYRRFIKVSAPGVNLDDLEAEAIASLHNVDSLKMDALNTDPTSTALVVSDDGLKAYAVKKATEAQMQKVEVLRRIVQAKVSEMGSIVHSMQEQVRAMTKIIGAIELYLGVREEITIIKDGVPASSNEPICLRQQVLFMDEEVGDPRWKNNQPGIDFQSIGDFDTWVANNADKVLPEKRGVVVLYPTRQRRTYSKNFMIQARMDAENYKSYLLIRNGERLYRIFTDTNLGRKRLFPGINEMEKLQEGNYFARKDVEKQTFSYKRNALLIQGLIDRTDVFQPIASRVDLFDPATYLDLLQFIRDDEHILPSDRLPFLKWKDEINAKIKRGSRIILNANHDWYKRGMSISGRFLRYYQHEHSVPPPPKKGIYTIEKLSGDELIILYNPKDIVYQVGWEYDPHERKNRLSFILYRRDAFVLNYDMISLADIEYYLNARSDRKNYLDNIPILWEIRERRLAEIEWEKHFVTLICTRLDCAEQPVWDAINWWKFKNVWKRPIAEDDAKALRMIESRVQRIA